MVIKFMLDKLEIKDEKVYIISGNVIFENTKNKNYLKY